jgi:hypothetical protein
MPLGLKKVTPGSQHIHRFFLGLGMIRNAYS